MVHDASLWKGSDGLCTGHDLVGPPGCEIASRFGSPYVHCGFPLPVGSRSYSILLGPCSIFRASVERNCSAADILAVDTTSHVSEFRVAKPDALSPLSVRSFNRETNPHLSVITVEKGLRAERVPSRSLAPETRLDRG